jgi:cytochrome P450
MGLLSAVIYGGVRGNRLEFFEGMAREHGDIAHVRMGGEHLYMLNHPQMARDVLVTHNRNFIKGRALERAKVLLGEGLLTSEGNTHLTHRRMMQPAFHRQRIAAYASAMTDYAVRTSDGWRDGGEVDVSRDMMYLTLAIVGQTLFDTDVTSQSREVGDALTAVLESFWGMMLPFSGVLERLPIRRFRQGRASRETLDRIVYAMIAERRASLTDRGDLLSMLLLAQDEEGDGTGLTDVQVRDEAMTIFLAGHETTANALAWTWYLLGEYPDEEARLHAELEAVLGGRIPTFDDVAKLRFTEQVVTESMRLYPPAWIIGRRAIDAYSVGGYELAPRSLVVVSPWALQRDARWFPDPLRFDPARWSADFKAALPKGAYIPFGGGPRQCIGEPFAWMELILLVATIAQRWKLRLVPGHVVKPQPVVTLRMQHGLRMTAHRRDAGPA